MTNPNHAAGDRDGYLIGPDGVDPDGNRVGYDAELWGDPDYLRGASEGRARRIDEQLEKMAASGERHVWPGAGS